jgi:hypothetical protein
MRKRAAGGGRASAARSLLVLGVVLLVAGLGASAALPRLRHALGGLLFGDNVSAGPPVVCRRGNVLAGVYNPWRLAVRAPCVTTVGRVVLVLQARDGDTHINVLPDRGYWHLLNRRNYLTQSGTLVVEVIPANRAQVPVPAIGTHVRVTGAYVTDLEHGWREIHPAWQIVPAP